jgi:hypothetical protein
MKLDPGRAGIAVLPRRGGNPLAGVYHPSRLRVKSRCRVAVGAGECPARKSPARTGRK